MRKLASVQRIKELAPIEGADQIEHAAVLGWHLVVKKSEFQIGDLCVYVEIDSIMPEREEFEFLRTKKFKIKTVKLRGQISQGICFPLSILPSGFNIIEDADCTDVLGITKYEPVMANFLKQKAATRIIFPDWMPDILIQFLRRSMPKFVERFFRKSIGAKTFPNFLVKTDETRVQVLQGLLDKYVGTPCYIAEKLDGSSVTYYVKDGVFGVCSRNLDFQKMKQMAFGKLQ